MRATMRRLSKLRLACVAGGIALAVAVSVGPVNRISETRLFSVHMAQHVALLDVVPLLFVLGLGGIRRRFAHPAPSFVLWCASLYVWHLPGLYDAALDHALLHLLQHACFLVTGFALWRAVLGFAPLAWRLGSIAAAGLASAVLGNLFLWAGHPFYRPYVDAPRLWGLSALADQRLGGAVMLGEGTLVMLGAATWIVLRWTLEAERAA